MTESKKEKMEVYCLNLAPVNLSRLYYIRRSRSRPPKKSMEAMTDFVNGAAGAKLRISIFLTEHRITLLAESECRFYQQGNHRHSSEKTNKYSWAWAWKPIRLYDNHQQQQRLSSAANSTLASTFAVSEQCSSSLAVHYIFAAPVSFTVTAAFRMRKVIAWRNGFEVLQFVKTEKINSEARSYVRNWYSEHFLCVWETLTVRHLFLQLVIPPSQGLQAARSRSIALPPRIREIWLKIDGIKVSTSNWHSHAHHLPQSWPKGENLRRFCLIVDPRKILTSPSRPKSRKTKSLQERRKKGVILKLRLPAVTSFFCCLLTVSPLWSWGWRYERLAHRPWDYHPL